MQYILAAPVVLFLLALAYGGATGRLRASSCCATPDPAKDLRMRAAFEDTEPGSD